METLIDQQGDHHPHRSLALVVSSIIDQASVSPSLWMDGIPPIVSFGNNM